MAPRLSRQDEDDLIRAIRKVVERDYSTFDPREKEDILNSPSSIECARAPRVPPQCQCSRRPTPSHCARLQVLDDMDYDKRDRLRDKDFDNIQRRVNNKAAELRDARCEGSQEHGPHLWRARDASRIDDGGRVCRPPRGAGQQLLEAGDVPLKPPESRGEKRREEERW